MPRSRNIKPGFFMNDKLAEVEPLGRLLFAGLWTIADREGRMEDRPKWIKAHTLPYDDCDIDELLEGLADDNFIFRYEAGGKQYIQVLNWDKHQNPHIKEAESEIPPPEQAPNEHHTSTIQAPNEHQTSRPDSFTLIPDSCTLIPDNVPTDEHNFLQTLYGVVGYPADIEKDRQLYSNLYDRYPEVDLTAVAKDWANYKLDKPLTKKCNPRAQINTFCKNSERWDKGNGKAREQEKRTGFSHEHSPSDLSLAIKRKTISFEEDGE